MDHTKIVATIGPASNSPEMLRDLAKAGMSIARLNGSHNSLDWHRETITLIRRELPDLPILMDIPGRKIRTTDLPTEPKFGIGGNIILTTNRDADDEGKCPVNYEFLHEDISVGATIMADDGTLRFTVTAIEGQDIHCRTETAGKLRSRKGINVPGITLRTPLVTDRDREMMGFLTENEVDFVGISFVESAKHVDAIRALRTREWPRIVSKIENRGGLDRMEEIIRATDAVMIDRGDLSVETNLESLALFQKEILSTAREFSKPVIVATEMLHTMIENPFPTKAEVSDITNAVIDGAAATMLSGETAVGNNPVAAVQTMRNIAEVTSDYIHQGGIYTVDDVESGTVDWQQPMAQAVALLSSQLPISKIVAVTRLGYAAQVVSAQGISQPIIAVSDDRNAARSFNLFPGTTGVFLDIAFQRDSADHIVGCLHGLWDQGHVSKDDVVLVIALAYPRSGNRMNHLQIHRIGDLAETLAWN
ncbi:MAG: pyruvate kinase [Rhodospirillales bacterium]|jgi:pyruvate kinase|nr:pyruvate kinase [Rhodospirillales bacterium]MBT4626131.1 pyruvate kinase [Rhodospirillales bacterium]MBT5350233.1 pyruvate kinase [Rhodospirillales bacterium]MBT5522271.1 pyruvate kinase [Rhodospirillales bacterium]MBT6109390.1 pyruvate kinase [Rhodospirillales bacterium]